MSRRRGEFEHRTSIFEGAFRAWSHLGGLRPDDLESKAIAELDPLTNPIVDDPRLTGKSANNPDGSTRREYPYEPLPRSGLAHPYVQAILSPWLGPDADNEAINLGLTTLRTWWQHRRKGESGSAIAALGTEKMKGVVEGYTRHFFTLAHCVVVNDKVQPPRGLHAKMKEREKMMNKKNKGNKKKPSGVGNETGGGGDDGNNPMNVDQIRADLTDPNLTPLEKLHVAQRRQLETSGGITSTLPSGMDVNPPLGVGAGGGGGGNNNGGSPGVIQLKSKCIPGKVDLPGVVDAVNRQATQLAHRGGLGVAATGTTAMPNEAISSAQQQQQQMFGGQDNMMMMGSMNGFNNNNNNFGDPNTTPVVFVSSNGDIQIAMKVDGITCAHCVKIVETVLRGCNGNKSPINGLLDAAADGDLNSVLIKIDKSSNAKRIAFESARNLSMVGYKAEPKAMSIVDSGADPKTHMDLGALSTAFEVVANTEPQDVFDWTIPCTCPDNGVLRGDCSRHSQMNTRIFEAFARREQQVTEYMAGCGMKYGMECTCGPSCRCKNCAMHNNGNEQQQQLPQLLEQPQMDVASFPSAMGQDFSEPAPFQMDQHQQPPMDQHQPPMFNNFGMVPPANNHPPAAAAAAAAAAPPAAPSMQSTLKPPPQENNVARAAQRNPSLLSYNNNAGARGSIRASLRGMSITSETTFGRAMSGLSALSIDWENLDDFDLEVDHSEHINGNGPAGVARRPSARRSIMSTGSNDGRDAHVSFKI